MVVLVVISPEARITIKHIVLLLLTGVLISQSVQADLVETEYKKDN